MENKKYLPLKIVHLIFMVYGLCYSVYSLFGIKAISSDAKLTAFVILQAVTAICALAFGFLYLTHGYKKNAAAYYKGYIWFLLIFEIFATISGNRNESFFIKFVWAIDLVLLTVLTVGKDLGKVKSFALVGLILIGKIILLVYFIVMLEPSSAFGLNGVLSMISQIVLTITTALMVCGKYLDKAERGAK